MKFAAMTMVGGAWTLGPRPKIAAKQFLPLAAIALLCVDAADAQTMYKYRGDDGVWIYTDRKPVAAQSVEVRQLESTFVAPAFSVSHDMIGRTIEFVAHNDFYAPIEVRLEFLEITGVEYPHPDQILRWLVDPRSDQLLLNLKLLEGATAPYVEVQYEYIPGDPTAPYSTDVQYLVPYSVGREFPVTQAYPDAYTHQTLDSVYAVDIAMPVGTNVLAARGGTVFDVASDNYRGGVDKVRDGENANIVRIVHDDGTMSVYAHLNWNSIRVKPGDRVKAGQYIADSGNTGFTSGPHLHFSVQRNAGLKIESLPIIFKGANSVDVVAATGKSLMAYP
jgi:murein DD-endopeptidase MepM/ murein hydrolase activator NlpD